MGFWDDAVDFAGDVVDAGVGAVGAVAEAVYDAAGNLMDGTHQFIGTFATTVVDIVDEVEDHTGMVMGRVSDGVGGWMDGWVKAATVVVETAVEATTTVVEEVVVPVVTEVVAPVIDETLTVIDTVVLDPISTATLGVVDIGYEGGNLGGTIGIDDVLQVGGSVGTDGASVQAENLVSGFELGVTADGGISASNRAGIDWGPFPHSEGHVSADLAGNVDIGGELGGVIPTPFGVLDTDTRVGYKQNDDGSWSTDVYSDNTLYTPDGAYGGTLDVAVDHEADGDTSVRTGLGASYDDYKGTAFEGNVGYQHVEDDGTTSDGVHVDGSYEADGTKVDGSVDVNHTDNRDGSSSTTVDTGVMVETDDMQAGGTSHYGRDEAADGSTVETFTLDGGYDDGATKVQGGLGYRNEENADGSSSESFGANVSVDSGDTHVDGGVQYVNERDSEGNEHERLDAGVNVQSGEVSGGIDGSYDRALVDGKETEQTSIGGAVQTDDFAVGGGYGSTTVTNADGSVIEQEQFSGSIQSGEYAASGSTTTTTSTTADGQQSTTTVNEGEIEGLDVGRFMEFGNDALGGSGATGGGLGGSGAVGGGLGGADIGGDLGFPGATVPDLSAPDLGIAGSSGFDAGAAVSAVPAPDQPADMVSALAGSGDLSDVLEDMSSGALDGGQDAIEAVATYADSGAFDDFTADIVGAEVVEASANELWEDLA